jgi:two-component system response regulator FlrC
MVEVESTGLSRLADELARIAPLAVFGFARRLTDRRVSVVHVCRHDVTHCTVPVAEVPHVVLPPGDDLRESVTTGTGHVSGAIEEVLRLARAGRLISAGIEPSAPSTRLWMASTSADAFTEEQRAAFRTAAGTAVRAIDVPMSLDAAVRRLNDLEQTDELLPTNLSGLDVRELFMGVAEIANRTVPHDFLLLQLFSDGLAEVTTVSLRDGQPELGPPAGCTHAPVVTRVWDYDLIDTSREYPVNGNGPAAPMGARSLLRLVMRCDGRVIGALTFGSFTAGGFSTTGVAVARRIADHAAAALWHHRLAGETRRAAALQERATNLEVLDGLLATLTGVLDVRAVFDRVSAIAQKVLPHDAMSISELVEGGVKVRIHASHGLGQLPEPYDMVLPEPRMAREPWDYRLFDDVRNYPEYAKGPGWAAGMRSMMFVSIQMEGRNWGGLNFYSKTVSRFSRDDVLVARRITDHVALALSHRRLADELRKSEALLARTASLELLDGSLAALADGTDVPSVLGTISGVVRRVLKHDGAVLIVRLHETGQARVYATSGLPTPLPEDTPIPDHLLDRSDWEHDIVDDLAQESAPLYERLSGLGFRTMIGVPIRMDGRFTGALALVGGAGVAFQPGDGLIVRRMADRLTVTMARDREIAAAHRADEATARAARLEARVKNLTEELDARTGYRRVVGESVTWRHVLKQAAQVAATDTTVLLLGESGTGKEVVARFLHRGSARSSGPFIALNCAALPEQLLEAELFGYERGAFTGATQSKPGQLEQAAGGTLFLDEVAEMSATAQPKFLRVLQEREFQRLGGIRVLRTDARIVAATNRDLQRSIATGQLREDLYYRLNVFAIRLPPLRERRDDILLLSEAFITEIGRGLGRPPAGISRDARQMLLEYPWPGNIRELRNVLERAAILCDGGLITADLLALGVASPQTPAPSLASAATPTSAVNPPLHLEATVAAAVPGDLPTMERVMIERALQTARFNKSKAAKTLGLTRHQLYIRMRKHGLE